MLSTLLALLLACSEAEPPAVEAPPAAPPPAATTPAAAPPPVDARAEAEALTPSPMQLQAEMQAAGVATALGPLVPATRFSRPVDDADTIALRTGVQVADAVLAGPTDSKERFLERLAGIRAGLAALGMGEGRLSEFDEFVTEVRNDAASRQDFVAELDRVVAEMVPEEGWGPGDTTGPLLQAGAWLAATNLVAQAVVAKGDDAAADALLKRPRVPTWYLDWAQGEGAAKANPATMEQVTSTLRQLQAITTKDTLTVADAQAIVDATGGLFGWM